jgi:PAS domain S-box-containing protein
MVELLNAEGRVTDFECSILNKKGEVRICITSLRLYRDTGILEGSIQDITERKQAEEALANERNLLRSLIDHVPVYIYVKDTQGRFLTANPALARLMASATPDELLGKTDFDFYPQELAAKYHADEQAIFQSGQSVLELEELIVDTAGNERWVSTTKVALRDAQGKIIGLVGMSRDITERKRAEEAVAKQHNLLLTLINNIPDVIYAKDNEGRKIISNTADWQASGGKGMEDVLGKTDFDSYPAELATQFWIDDKLVLDSGEPIINREEPGRDSQGNLKWILTTKVPLRDVNSQVVVGLVGIGHDITKRKQAEAELHDSEIRYRTLFEDSPISLWEEDFSAVKQRIKSLRQQGVTDFQNFFKDNPQVVIECVGLIKVLDVNKASLRMLHARKKADLKKNLQVTIQSEAYLGFANELLRIAEGGTEFEWEGINFTLDGEPLNVSVRWQAAPGCEESLSKVYVSIMDITERKQAEEQLRQSENFLRQIIDLVPYFIFAKDKESRFLLTNKANADAYGTTTTDIVGKSDSDFSATLEQAHHFHEDDLAVINGEEPKFIPEETFKDIHGNIRYLQTTKIPFQFGPAKVSALLGVAVDITERKQAEEAIHHHITELETLHESGLVLSQLLSPREIAQKLIELMSLKLNWHHTTIRLYHPENETLELLAFNVLGTLSSAELQATEYRFKTMIAKVGDGLTGWAVQHRQVVRVADLSHDSRYLETEPDLHSGIYVPLKVGERMVGVISIETEMPDAFSEADERLVLTLANQAAAALENARLHEETLHQVKRLEALHTIDQYIAGSFDQRLTLELLLTHTLDQLEVDAAVIFLLEPYQRTLQYAVGKGFQTHMIESANLRLGESLAGRAAIERRMIHVNDQEAKEPHPMLAKLWSEEGMRSMYSLPLIAKGQVKGVLSVYHRKAFIPDSTWINFLNTLAGQAAIAVDSMQLFNGLQRANMDLTIAYDATIEGWSQAMDLRDKETEGHTKRVTEMSMQIGKAMQLGEEYLVHLRRGALLHDIGKLGVPDHILLKPDKLTDEEWQIMKKHPQFAYDMLHSVAYLRRALDIPYCHHEKWDGTGYPQGLKGEQIPLSARIFTIVDVWDALTSDRPYREAWSKPDALKYIREQSGKNFDPQVVEIFLKEFGHE